MDKVTALDFDKLYTLAVNWLLLNGPRILIAGVVFLLGQWIIRLVRKWLTRAMTRRDVHSSVRPFLQSLILTVIQVLLIVVVMQVLGIQLTIFAAAVASLGVTVGLALSGTLQNFACGLLILFLRPFKVGDHIIAQAQEGIVTSIQIFYTVVKTKDNRTVIIPNSKLSNEVIVKIADDIDKKIEFDIKFNYDADADLAEQVIRETISQSDDLQPAPAPVVGVFQFEHDGYQIKTEVWSTATSVDNARRSLQKRVIANLKTAHIVMPVQSTSPKP